MEVDIRQREDKSVIYHACGHEETHAWPDADFLDGETGEIPMRILRNIWEETICERPCSRCVEQPRFVRR